MVGPRVDAGTIRSHMLRPGVAARSVREARCSCRAVTGRRGSPTESADQVEPPSPVRKTPTSVAAYRVFGKSGSTTTSFTGMLGRLPLMSIQEAPPVAVLKTWPWESPEKPEKPENDT